MWKKILCTALLLCLTALPLTADDSGDQLRVLANDTRAQAGNLLSTCAADRGLTTQGEPVFMSTEDTASVLMPLAGVESLTRADLATWTNIGVFTVSGPVDADAPSGTFTVRVQAEPGSTVGEYEIVDAAGTVVQSGELMISDDPDADMAPSAPTSSVLDSPLGGSMLPKENIHFGSPWCYYPYYWHWRIYPYYYHGCYWWWYRWPWGHLKFRYCWWPSYYHCTRWFCHWW